MSTRRPVAAFTTTVPVEILIAAGYAPLDLNNIFITDNDPASLVDAAADIGIPRTICGWIRGLASVIMRDRPELVVAVTGGDCSNNEALMELLIARDIPVMPFSYPVHADDRHAALFDEMARFAKKLGTTLDEAKRVADDLIAPIRTNLRRLDALTVEGKATGFENHLWQVSASDFNGDVETFGRELAALLDDIESRKPAMKNIRIGVVGVPTIFTDFYDVIESFDAKVVFNEVQRQFTILSDDDDYVRRYADYTYPYDIFGRLDDIRRQIDERKIDGVIHYVQSFCHRAINDILIRENAGVPVLTVEGDAPGPVDGRTRIRIESFIEMLGAKK